MSVFLYQGGMKLVGKSGVGQAVLHQKSLLNQAGIQTVEHWKEPSDVVHINTVFPDSVLASVTAKLLGKKVVYYGHSTMEDFRNSFHGSNQLAPVFKHWIKFCYSLGDVVLTPTEYSKQLIEGYGIRRPVYSISNGIDTEFFAPSSAARERFRRKYALRENEQVVISVGHYIERKGILEFIDLARRMPQTRFFWFGYTNLELVPQNVQDAIAAAPENLTFPGYVDRAQLRDAYCGADAFVFLSHEETEGIVVLEALSCGIPTVLRDIPVYSGWLEDGKSVYKIHDGDETAVTVSGLLNLTLPDLTPAGRAVAESRSYAAVGRRLLSIYAAEKLLNPSEKLKTAGNPVRQSL